MRVLALASDYDGTLAHAGTVRPETCAALQRLRASGRKLILVTGRELEDLKRVCPRLDLFDRVVAENGALLYRPETGEERLLAEPPPPALASRLRARGATPLSEGRVIVATREPHQVDAVEVIRELQLEQQVIFNKGAVMILPSGVNKQTGLAAALAELGLSLRNCVAVGDAENDHAMLAASECGVAVANALDALKDRADLVTRASRGQGVEELIARLLEDDLRSVMIARQALLLGVRRDGTEVRLAPAGRRVLVAGPPGSGKTTAAAGFLARVIAAGYQCCVLDQEGGPEGGLSSHEGLLCLGTSARAPSPDEILAVLDEPGTQVAVRLCGLPLRDRPGFLAQLVPRLQALRDRTGRPHWLVLDEAHLLLSASPEPGALPLPRELGGVLLVTALPERLPPEMLAAIDTALAVGDRPGEALRPFLAGQPLPPFELEPGEVLAWWSGQLEPLRLLPGDERADLPVRGEDEDVPGAGLRDAPEAGLGLP